jgi:hypothetical protein
MQTRLPTQCMKSTAHTKATVFDAMERALTIDQFDQDSLNLCGMKIQTVAWTESNLAVSRKRKGRVNNVKAFEL